MNVGLNDKIYKECGDAYPIYPNHQWIAGNDEVEFNAPVVFKGDQYSYHSKAKAIDRGILEAAFIINDNFSIVVHKCSAMLQVI